MPPKSPVVVWAFPLLCYFDGTLWIFHTLSSDRQQEDSAYRYIIVSVDDSIIVSYLFRFYFDYWP